MTYDTKLIMEKEALVDLLFEVQAGRCSCRAAADLILKAHSEDLIDLETYDNGYSAGYAAAEYENREED